MLFYITSFKRRKSQLLHLYLINGCRYPLAEELSQRTPALATARYSPQTTTPSLLLYNNVYPERDTTNLNIRTFFFFVF